MVSLETKWKIFFENTENQSVELSNKTDGIGLSFKFMLVPNSKELEGYFLEKILNLVNHPSQVVKIPILTNRMIGTQQTIRNEHKLSPYSKKQSRKPAQGWNSNARLFFSSRVFCVRLNHFSENGHGITIKIYNVDFGFDITILYDLLWT